MDLKAWATNFDFGAVGEHGIVRKTARQEGAEARYLGYWPGEG